MTQLEMENKIDELEKRLRILEEYIDRITELVNGNANCVKELTGVVKLLVNTR